MNTDERKINEERISHYLKGDMTQEEERQFENDIREDVVLKEQAEVTSRMILAMDKVGKAHDKTLISEMSQTKWIAAANITDRGGSILPFTKWIAAVACLLFVCLAGYKYYDTQRIIGLGEQYSTTFSMDGIIRGNEDQSTIEELKKLFGNVEMGEDLTSTLTQLTRLWQQTKSETYNAYTEYQPYIGWYLATGYLRDNNKAAAKEILIEMQKMYPVDTAMGDKVRELMDKL